MICDSHIHVGQFYETYISPQQLIELIKPLDIERYAVSSTTVCEENYPKVLNELEYLLTHEEKKVDPIFWMTPSLIQSEKVLKLFLESGFKWKCIKIHPLFHPKLWINNSDLFKDVIAFAKKLNLPLLIHTGGQNYSDIEVWDKIIPAYPDQTFIFAHCRPFDQAVNILQKYSNAYGDLSFVDVYDFPRLISENIWNKILWGSDIPINEYFFRDISTKDYYIQRLEILKEVSNEQQLETMLSKNYYKLFKT
ncbi:MAG: amidohydrolase family protein [Muribaculaceae bacterium]|nr:amidohydrolase family protein [Muribaculaceae bacterium]